MCDFFKVPCSTRILSPSIRLSVGQSVCHKSWHLSCFSQESKLRSRGTVSECLTSVRYASREKNHISWLFFWPQRDCKLDKTIDKQVLRSCFDGYVRNGSSLSVCSSIRLSMYRTYSARNSIHAVTQDVSLPGRACYMLVRYSV